MARTYSIWKRDHNGRLYETVLKEDPRGRGYYRPAGAVAVTSCRLCGGNNYSATYSTCSRCAR